MVMTIWVIAGMIILYFCPGINQSLHRNCDILVNSSFFKYSNHAITGWELKSFQVKVTPWKDYKMNVAKLIPGVN